MLLGFEFKKVFSFCPKLSNLTNLGVPILNMTIVFQNYNKKYSHKAFLVTYLDFARNFAFLQI